MCAVLLAPGVTPFAVNIYMLSYISHVFQIAETGINLFLSGEVCRPCTVSFINKAAIYYWIIFRKE